MRGGVYSTDERLALLDYCASDVDALGRLFPKMLPTLDLPRALLRGRYMAAVARMEHTGVPIDVDMLGRFRESWAGIKDQLIAEVDRRYGCYDGQSFRQERFARWLVANDIPWPLTAQGRLALDQDTFRQQSRRFPQVAELRELRHSLSELKLEKLAVGRDCRNRCLLSPFSSRSGRNQPSNNRFIFGPSVWLRGLIKPGEGMAISYIDWCQQELGVAASLSNDPAMLEAYRSSDPYLAFAKQAGAVPQTATKQSHPDQRAQFKICSLGVQYGMSEVGLCAGARQAGSPRAEPAADASGNLPAVLALVPRASRRGDAAGPYRNRVRVAIAHSDREQPAEPGEFSDASPRRRAAAVGVLRCDRRRYPALRTDP